jgi:hypothetical protein
MPALSLILRESFPTAKYDHLGDHPNDGAGAGAYATTLGLFGQTIIWLPNGRILRARLDLLQQFSQSASLTDVSVYGTPQGFRGKAQPGGNFSANAAFEYSLGRSWVAALDLIYGFNADGRVTGRVGMTNLDFELTSSRPLAIAPALEYNWRDDMGLLLGVRYIPQGRDVTASVTPGIALSVYF